MESFLIPNHATSLFLFCYFALLNDPRKQDHILVDGHRWYINSSVNNHQWVNQEITLQ